MAATLPGPQGAAMTKPTGYQTLFMEPLPSGSGGGGRIHEFGGLIEFMPEETLEPG